MGSPRAYRRIIFLGTFFVLGNIWSLLSLVFHTDAPRKDAAKHQFSVEPETQKAVAENTVYPWIIGGLGNQLHVASAAVILARNTGRRVVMNAKQTGVASFGIPQPVFWHTVFHSPIFEKDSKYAETNADRMSEEDFKLALSNDFNQWQNTSRGIILAGAFLDWHYFVPYRDLLKDILKPSDEVQRWINDAAVQLGLVAPSGESSLSASFSNETYAAVKLSDYTYAAAKRIDEDIRNRKTRVQRGAVFGQWSCEPPPAACDRTILPIQCAQVGCADNVAIHVRLQDRSSRWDYWSSGHLKMVNAFISKCLILDKHVVIFSNDIVRARKLLAPEHERQKTQARLSFSNHLDIVEFYLMSQYFGVHILTGSTYQLWSIFLSPLNAVKVLTMSDVDDFEFSSSMENSPIFNFEELRV